MRNWERSTAIADFRRAIALEPNLKEPVDGSPALHESAYISGSLP